MATPHPPPHPVTLLLSPSLHSLLRTYIHTCCHTCSTTHSCPSERDSWLSSTEVMRLSSCIWPHFRAQGWRRTCVLETVLPSPLFTKVYQTAKKIFERTPCVREAGGNVDKHLLYRRYQRSLKEAEHISTPAGSCLDALCAAISQWPGSHWSDQTLLPPGPQLAEVSHA